MDKVSQRRKIMAYMREHGSITPKDAEKLFRCMRLASRIDELRNKEGHKEILTVMESYIDEDGTRVRYARYVIAE